VKIAKGRRIPTAMLKIVLRRIFYFPNAVWASASGGFRIVSDTLVASVLLAVILSARLSAQWCYDLITI